MQYNINRYIVILIFTGRLMSNGKPLLCTRTCNIPLYRRQIRRQNCYLLMLIFILYVYTITNHNLAKNVVGFYHRAENSVEGGEGQRLAKDQLVSYYLFLSLLVLYQVFRSITVSLSLRFSMFVKKYLYAYSL